MLCRLLGVAVLFLHVCGAHADSTCFGTTSNGRIEDACKLPVSGENFETYSSMLSTVGRTYVHCAVQAVLLDAYALLEKKRPDTVYVYAETGKKNGGPFKLQKTRAVSGKVLR